MLYQVVGLVDPQDEGQLREEERGGSVVDDAGLVAAHGSQTEEEDGEEEEAQRHPRRAPRQHFDGQDLSVLTRERAGVSVSHRPADRLKTCGLTSLLETSISTAKLVMW